MKNIKLFLVWIISAGGLHSWQGFVREVLPLFIPWLECETKKTVPPFPKKVGGGNCNIFQCPVQWFHEDILNDKNCTRRNHP